LAIILIYNIISVFYHRRSGVLYFGPVCESATLESIDVWKFIFAHPVYCERIRVKFI